jgi:hypothetical protein
MNTKEENQVVDLNNFANLVGFPVELVKKELFNSNEEGKEVTLNELRQAMLTYLDNTMLND